MRESWSNIAFLWRRFFLNGLNSLVKLLIEHKVRRTKFSQHDKDVTKLAKYILLTFAFFHMTSFGILIINSAANTPYKHFVYLVTQCYIALYSPINTLNFFCVNRQSKRYIKNLFRKCIWRLTSTTTSIFQRAKLLQHILYFLFLLRQKIIVFIFLCWMMGSSEEKFESYTKALQVSDTPCKIKVLIEHKLRRTKLFSQVFFIKIWSECQGVNANTSVFGKEVCIKVIRNLRMVCCWDNKRLNTRCYYQFVAKS